MEPIKRKPHPISLAMGFGTGVETKICDISNSPERIRLIPRVVDKKRLPKNIKESPNMGSAYFSSQPPFRPGIYIERMRSAICTRAM